MENINVNTVETEQVPSKLIFNIQLAKFLVEEKGQQIIGLKANKTDKSKTVFVFLDGLSLRDAMQEYNKLSRQRRAERAKAESEEEVKEPIEQED